MDFTITIQGTGALIMHSARLSDPLDPITKAIKKVTSKRTKTDDDQEEIARLEFTGSLYMDPDVGPYIPGENIQRCLLDAAKVNKLGVKVTRGLFISTDINPIAYSGPRTADDLWKDENFRIRASVKVGTARTMRTRPIFRQWRTEAQGILDTDQLDFDQLQQIAENAGLLIGLGDWRPRYGRFSATVVKV